MSLLHELMMVSRSPSANRLCVAIATFTALLVLLLAIFKFECRTLEFEVSCSRVRFFAESSLRAHGTSLDFENSWCRRDVYLNTVHQRLTWIKIIICDVVCNRDKNVAYEE